MKKKFKVGDIVVFGSDDDPFFLFDGTVFVVIEVSKFRTDVIANEKCILSFCLFDKGTGWVGTTKAWRTSNMMLFSDYKKENNERP